MSKLITTKKIKSAAGRKKYTWNLTSLYRSDSDPKIAADMMAVKKANYRFINKWQSRNDYLKDSKILCRVLDELENLEAHYGLTGKFGYYFGLRDAQEEDNPILKGWSNKIGDFAVKIANDLQFFSLRLAKISASTQKKFLAASELKPYRYWLKRLFDDAKHLLSEPEEKIMNLKGRPAHSLWVDMTQTLLAKQTRTVYDESGKLAVKPFSEIASLTSSRIKKVRHRALATMIEISSRYAEVAEAEMNAIALDKKINDELRGFARPDISRHQSDDIDTKVIDALIETVADQFKTAQNYYRLKARLFGKKQLDYNERNVPYGKIEKQYSWSAAHKLVNRVLYRLDKDFGDIFSNFVKNGQFDVFPYQGKTGGAFCSHNLKNQPVYILLNHTGKLSDVLTLAHEAGHGINNELMRRRQNAFYFNTSLATAEVASTFMEDFVLAELAREADDKLRLSLAINKLNDEISTVFRQVAAYRFEQEFHIKFRATGYLAKETIGKIFQKHMTAYMGPAVAQPAGVENFWVPWSHVRNFFYVYSYASGLLISKSLQRSVRENPKFIESVKEFLAAGTSNSPKAIFQKLGIDIGDKKFWQKGLAEISDRLKETEKLAKKLGKI